MASQCYTTPHSCKHCQQIIFMPPDDTLHTREADIQSSVHSYDLLQWKSTFEVEWYELHQKAREGCLFYRFILSGLERIQKNRDKKRERRLFETSQASSPLDVESHVIDAYFDQHTVYFQPRLKKTISMWHTPFAPWAFNVCTQKGGHIFFRPSASLFPSPKTQLRAHLVILPFQSISKLAVGIILIVAW